MKKNNDTGPPSGFLPSSAAVCQRGPSDDNCDHVDDRMMSSSNVKQNMMAAMKITPSELEDLIGWEGLLAPRRSVDNSTITNKNAQACCKFLMRQLHPTNCLGIRNFADTHACKELHKRSHKFALQNFQEVMGTEEFLLLPFQEVDELIASSQLNVDKEEKVFQATIAWVRHEYPERRKYVFKLLRHVHLPLISREFLMTTVDSEPLVRENPDCKELMLEASYSANI